MHARRLTLLALVVVLTCSTATDATTSFVPLKEGAALLFADERSRDRFLEYMRFLDDDPEKFAHEIATIHQLERSDIQFVISVSKPLGRGIEGCLTSDGDRVVIQVSDTGGVTGEIASLNSRFAHELEHARQFDSGEFALVRTTTTGEWTSDYYSYDISDEVRAWTSQLKASTTRDFWRHRHGDLVPTTLRFFSDAKTDKERAAVLMRHGYERVNPLFNRTVRVPAQAGLAVGDVMRPTAATSFFGRVSAIDDRQPS